MKTNFKRILSLILVIFFIFTAAVPVLAQMADEAVSTDTTTAMRMQPLIDKYNSLTQVDLDKELAKYKDSTTHWGKEYISKISALEIINGYGNGKFGANDKLLGGQFILMLIRTMGYRLEVPQGTPYYKPYADMAIKEGILNKGEIVDYNKPITRELAVSLARRVLGTYEKIPTDYFVKGVDTEGVGDKGFFDNVYVGYQKIKMTDYTTITSKYLQDVIDCYRMGIIGGSGNKFTPKGNLTRAESAVIIVKLLDKSSRIESIPSDSESFKFMNTPTMDKGSCSDEYGYYEDKDYLLYKGYFPLMEIWDTVNAMNKNKSKIVNGACHFGFTEKSKGFGMGWFINSEIERQYRTANWNGLILPVNSISVDTKKTQINKGTENSIYDNTGGYLYSVSCYDVDTYSSIKPYVTELMKVWFGADYSKAKNLHDQYLGYSLRNEEAKKNFYLINGRQIYIAGGNSLGGNIFCMQVWAKDAITKDTMFKY